VRKKGRAEGQRGKRARGDQASVLRVGIRREQRIPSPCVVAVPEELFLHWSSSSSSSSSSSTSASSSSSPPAAAGGVGGDGDVGDAVPRLGVEDSAGRSLESAPGCLPLLSVPTSLSLSRFRLSAAGREERPSSRRCRRSFDDGDDVTLPANCRRRRPRATPNPSHQVPVPRLSSPPPRLLRSTIHSRGMHSG